MFAIETTKFPSHSQRMIVFSNKINSYTYSIYSIAKRLEYLAELSITDLLINVKFRSLENNLHSLSENFMSLANTLDDITEIYVTSYKMNIAECTDSMIGLTYEQVLEFRADSAAEPVSQELYELFLKKLIILDDKHAGVAHYSSSKGGILYNSTNDITNTRGPGSTYFHEMGHMIDDLSDKDSWSSIDGSYKFYDSLKADFNKYLYNVMVKGNLDITATYKKISKELWADPDNKCALSDIIAGLSNKSCAGKWTHEEQGYYTKESISIEAFAHFFEAGMSNTDDKINYIKEVFPNAYKEYLKIAQDEIDSFSLDKILSTTTDFFN